MTLAGWHLCSLMSDLVRVLKEVRRECWRFLEQPVLVPSSDDYPLVPMMLQYRTCRECFVSLTSDSAVHSLNLHGERNLRLQQTFVIYKTFPKNHIEYSLHFQYVQRKSSPSVFYFTEKRSQIPFTSGISSFYLLLLRCRFRLRCGL